MSVPEILRSITDGFQANATVKNVYGEPITSGNYTVVPVARISCAFGGGGGKSEGSEKAAPGSGGGGGGRMSAVPIGMVEITPEGSHFIPIPDWKRLAVVGAIGLVAGFIIGKRRA